mmetsp:Transcript_13079/g.21065  ORF Transcript_13079/g.21065 Transcript_13079/m.21065 type:complete len:90 (-) Transcript_13079:236-505(-)
MKKGVRILSGDLVWIKGPYEPGIWNDISMFRNALFSELDDRLMMDALEKRQGMLGVQGQLEAIRLLRKCLLLSVTSMNRLTRDSNSGVA